MANIAVVTTGGTISSTYDADGVSTPTVSGVDTLAVAGRPRPDADIDVVDIMSIDSAAMRLRDFDRVREAVAAALSDPLVDGVVVLHGTDTLEESALLVDLMHDDPRPVVFTGAQRTADHPDSDGPANLAHAIDVALDPASRGRGALIVFAGSVFPVRATIKLNTDDAAAFGTRPTPAIAGRRTTLAPVRISGVRVDIVALYPGCDRVQLDAVVAAGARGVVLEALGSGNTNEHMVSAVHDACRAGVVVAVSTRVPHGPVITSYGGGGGGADLIDAGALGTGYFRAGQARILLAALIAGGHDTAATFSSLCAETVAGQLD